VDAADRRPSRLSFRDKDQIAVSGWWTALTTSTQNMMYRAPEGDGEVLSGTTSP
jgi:hypothetical protein